MRLQLSLDRLDISGALELLSETADQVDIIEVGTPLLIREGLRAVRQIRAAYPQHQILADLKAMDGGAYEAEMAVTAGANIVTVLAAANSSTIQGAIQAAHRLGGLVMVDMIAVQDLAGRAKQVDQMGADYVCVHTAKDIQSSGHTPLQDLKVVSSLLCKAGRPRPLRFMRARRLCRPGGGDTPLRRPQPGGGGPGRRRGHPPADGAGGALRPDRGGLPGP